MAGGWRGSGVKRNGFPAGKNNSNDENEFCEKHKMNEDENGILTFD